VIMASSLLSDLVSLLKFWFYEVCPLLSRSLFWIVSHSSSWYSSSSGCFKGSQKQNCATVNLCFIHELLIQFHNDNKIAHLQTCHEKKDMIIIICTIRSLRCTWLFLVSACIMIGSTWSPNTLKKLEWMILSILYIPAHVYFGHGRMRHQANLMC
jgi:hypothetical protein